MIKGFIKHGTTDTFLILYRQVYVPVLALEPLLALTPLRCSVDVVTTMRHVRVIIVVSLFIFFGRSPDSKYKEEQ